MVLFLETSNEFLKTIFSLVVIKRGLFDGSQSMIIKISSLSFSDHHFIVSHGLHYGSTNIYQKIKHPLLGKMESEGPDLPSS